MPQKSYRHQLNEDESVHPQNVEKEKMLDDGCYCGGKVISSSKCVLQITDDDLAEESAGGAFLLKPERGDVKEDGETEGGVTSVTHVVHSDSRVVLDGDPRDVRWEEIFVGRDDDDEGEMDCGKESVESADELSVVVNDVVQNVVREHSF